MKLGVGIDNLLITSRGLLRPHEIDDGCQVLGVDRHGKLVMSVMGHQGSGTRQSAVVTFYTERTEITASTDTGIWGQGLDDVDYLLAEVEKDRYRHGRTLEVALDLGKPKWWREDPLVLGDYGDATTLDAHILGSMVRRVPFLRDPVTVRVPKSRSNAVFKSVSGQASDSLLLSGSEITLSRGRYWDWIRIADTALSAFLAEFWPDVQEIPLGIRCMPFPQLIEFVKGAIGVTLFSESELLTFPEERLLRSLLYHVLTATRREYSARPKPLYRVAEIRITLGTNPEGEARIRSWETSQGEIVNWQLTNQYWSPLVNLSMLESG